MKVKIRKDIYEYYEEFHFTRGTYKDDIEIDISEDLYDKLYKAMHDYEESQEILKKLYEEAINESKN